MQRFAVVVLCILVMQAPGNARADSSLAAAIDAVINGPDYKHAHWGIWVADAQTGEELYTRDALHLFFPASTTKLYSCAAAMADLGSDYRFHTPVYARGQIKDGKLNGQLILRAVGDLTMGGRTDDQGHMAFKDDDHIYANGNNNGALTATDPLAGLKELARQVAKAGIHEIAGDVLIDDRLWVESSGSGPDVLTPIMINDNLVDILITPATEVGKPAEATIRPGTSYIQMDAQVDTVDSGKPTRVDIIPIGPSSFALRGQIAKGAKPLLRIFAVGDPAAFARALFIEVLVQAGVHVRGSKLQAPTSELPEEDGYLVLPRVATFDSPPLSEAIKVTLKVSHNLYGSTLPLLIAAKHGRRTLTDGLRLQGKKLAEMGVDVASISFGGGAGGSNADAVTPRATGGLLQALAKRPDYPAFEAGLPILGVDGTLASAVPAGSPARGHVHAKTGTLFWYDRMNDRNLLTSKALAGTMTTASGRKLIVCLFVNNVPLSKGVSPSREGKTLGHLCEVIYQKVP
jgi:D-alanyl-D-alanine carboxypeptidase/D-alanyl-D-alanine-endopeptidase (penicillin-binding protein 4)